MRLLVVLFTFLGITLFLAGTAWAQESGGDSKAAPQGAFRSPVEAYRIDAIVVRGLTRTRRSVIERELLFEEGEVATIAEIRESIQRLRNLGLFRWASFELRDERVPLPDGEFERISEGPPPRVLHIEVDERWTVIPFFTLSQGGGIFALSVGAFDINVFGRYYESGIQYTRFGTANSVVGWFYNPRFLDQRLFAGASGSWTNRVRAFYTDDGELEGGYFRERRSLVGALNKEWHPWVRTGAQLRVAHDSFSYSLVPDALVEAQENSGGLPDAYWDIPASVSLALGDIDQYSYLLEGARLSTNLQVASELWGSGLSYVEWTSTARGYLRLPLKANIGARVGVGATSASDFEHLFYLGGFSAVRGYVDSRFRGSHYWYANAEFRIPSLDSRWLVLQHIAFVDVTGVGDKFGELLRVDGASSGVGIRILSPKIYSLVARFDYAFPFLGSRFSQFSFGSQQFF